MSKSERMTSYKWATEYADALDDLDARRDALREELSARECGDLFARWGAAVAGRGVLRNSDKLAIELCYPSAEFITHSSGAYCRGIHYVIVYRNGATHRATLRVNGDVRAVGGELSYFVDDDGAVRLPSCFITDTTLPDGARKIINDVAADEWRKLAVSCVELWRECLTFAIRAELYADRAPRARSLVREYGGY